MNWEEANEVMGEGNKVKLPNLPSALRVEMGTYIECWQDGREVVIHGPIREELKKSDEWEIVEWNSNE